MNHFSISAEPFDHSALMRSVKELEDTCPLLTVRHLTHSILDRPIPLLELGTGKRKCLYVGAHHGMEWITAALLIRFVRELCQSAEEDRRIGKLSPATLLETHTLYIIPMLNPDGVEYQIHGVTEENPLYERLLSMNGQSQCFSHWQANARGVDLNHNYDAGFEEYKKLEAESDITQGAPTRYSGPAPESEPETRALCDLIRFHNDLLGVMTLHTQGEEIYFQSGAKVPKKSNSIAKKLADLTGYRPSTAEGLASYGGLTDWCVQKLDLPAFTLECGRGENPLPYSMAASIYVDLRQALFTFPTLL